jgi:PA14 domain
MQLTLLLALPLLNGVGEKSLYQSPPAASQQPVTAIRASQDDSDAPIFRINAREVIIDLIALHGRDEPVLDLTPADLQISESSVAPGLDPTEKPERRKGNARAERETIASLQLVDLDTPQDSDDDARGGFEITASCLERSTRHYRLAFRAGPDAWRSGYHMVVISTTRRGVKLFFRHQYYIGLTEPPEKPLDLQDEAIKRLLLRAACYYPATPPSISLRARFIDTGRTDVLRYSVAIDSDSLSFVTVGATGLDAGIDRHVALDYGICNFDRGGRPVSFFHAPVEKVLSSAEYARALDRGFPHLLEFPAPQPIAMTRVVVRDRATGNLGAVEVAHPTPEPPAGLQEAPAAAQTAADLNRIEAYEKLGWSRDADSQQPLIVRPAEGPIGSFGSIVPAPHAFCGDVYELPHSSLSLPDFRELDPIGSLYTSALDVPDQIFENTSGIPGVTPRTNLFGIDYHGVLWVTNPGNYQFLMISDDGAILRIDDKEVIDLDGLHMAEGKSGKIHLDAGRHTIAVPYYQGAVNAVALELWIKPPGAHTWALFDIDDFAQPGTDSGPSAPR